MACRSVMPTTPPEKALSRRRCKSGSDTPGAVAPRTTAPSPSSTLHAYQLVQLAQGMGVNVYSESEQGYAADTFASLSQELRNSPPSVPTAMPPQLYEPPSASSALVSMVLQPAFLAVALPDAMTVCKRIDKMDESELPKVSETERERRQKEVGRVLSTTDLAPQIEPDSLRPSRSKSPLARISGRRRNCFIPWESRFSAGGVSIHESAAMNAATQAPQAQEKHSRTDVLTLPAPTARPRSASSPPLPLPMASPPATQPTMSNSLPHVSSSGEPSPLPVPRRSSKRPSFVSTARSTSQSHPPVPCRSSKRPVYAFPSPPSVAMPQESLVVAADGLSPAVSSAPHLGEPRCRSRSLLLPTAFAPTLPVIPASKTTRKASPFSVPALDRPSVRDRRLLPSISVSTGVHGLPPAPPLLSSSERFVESPVAMSFSEGVSAPFVGRRKSSEEKGESMVDEHGDAGLMFFGDCRDPGAAIAEVRIPCPDVTVEVFDADGRCLLACCVFGA